MYISLHLIPLKYKYFALQNTKMTPFLQGATKGTSCTSDSLNQNEVSDSRVSVITPKNVTTSECKHQILFYIFILYLYRNEKQRRKKCVFFIFWKEKKYIGKDEIKDKEKDIGFGDSGMYDQVW